MNRIVRNKALVYFFNHLDLEILENGYAVLDKSWNQRDVCSPFSRLYYVVAGEGILTDRSGAETRMTPGRLYFVPAGMPFHYRCDATFEKLYFHVTVRGTDRYDIMVGCREILSFPSREAEDGSLLALYSKSDPTDAAALRALLWRDVSTVLSAMREPPRLGAVYSPLVRRAIGYIRSHLSNRLRTAEIASALFVSPSCLSSHFRREVGISIGRYVDDMINFRAEELLLRDELSIGEIAARLGFCDQFYFARKFRQSHEESPNRFRRRQLNQV